jgi:UDP-N-acetylmuramoylalanine--D-glutamate ligase
MTPGSVPGPIPFRRVGVVGLGRSGAAAARILARRGVEVLVSEREDSPALSRVAAELATLGVETELGPHRPEIVDGAEALVVSPGVPPDNPVIVRALERGLPVWSEVELAWRLAGGIPLLAVTGTNGKTTTTSLLAAILQEGGLRAVAAGNIGFPLIEAVAELASGPTPAAGVIVCEVSSFQLAFTEMFRPDVAVVLNVADDHYDWHGGHDDYLRSKARIAAAQFPVDLLIANSADAGAMAIAAGAPSRAAAFGLGPLRSVRAAAASGRSPVAVAGVESGFVVAEGSAGPASILDAGKIRLAGRHNLENVLAASLAALEWGVQPEVIGRAVAAFSPLPHRSTVIGEVNGVRYIDDSKATNPHATLRALEGLERVVLIAGGRAKGLDLSVLTSLSPRLVGVIAMGEATGELEEHFSRLVRFAGASCVEEAVVLAAQWASAGDTVLLSPACSSLDQYASYAERGDRFCAAVRSLEGR